MPSSPSNFKFAAKILKGKKDSLKNKDFFKTHISLIKRYDDFPFLLFPAPTLARAWASVGWRAEDDSWSQPQAAAPSCCLPPTNQSRVWAAVSQSEARIVTRPAPPPLSRECFLRPQRQLQSRTGSRPGRSRQVFSLSGILFLESSSNNSENQQKSLIKRYVKIITI